MRHQLTGGHRSGGLFSFTHGLYSQGDLTMTFSSSLTVRIDLVDVLVSYCCYNKLSQTQRLKATQIYYHTEF